MIELDDRLRALGGQAREWAADLRPHALDLDRDPAVVHRHLRLPMLDRLATLQIPPSHNPDPLRVGPHRFSLMSAIERLVFIEEAAYGDLGMMLAAPGAPMAGLVVALLGDRAQQDWFYGSLLSRPTWTFFALTEPQGGSDATAMQTRLEPAGNGDFLLSGTKRFIGNALRAGPGVAFARTGTGPLATAAVLVDSSDAGFRAEPVPTLGLRGAELGALRFDHVRIPAERVLGVHQSALRRGLWAWARTFNLLRPSVAAMAIGLARAAHDYTVTHRGATSTAGRDRLEVVDRRIAGARQLALRAAIEADADPDRGGPAAMAKLRACALAEDVTRQVLEMFGPGAALDHPLLEKLARDARALSFMEGTGNMQRLAVAGELLRRG